MKVEPE